MHADADPEVVVGQPRTVLFYFSLCSADFLHSYGYQGHECLLRAICETSEHYLRHNGLIGDILHVIFT